MSHLSRNFNKNELKKILQESSQKIELKELSSEIEGKIILNVEGVNFHTLILGSDTKRFFVFLSANGISNKPYPLFHRVLWAKYFKGVCIYIDDPTRSDLSFAPCYFYGNQERDVGYLIKKIIEKYANLNNILKKNIHLISSSNGGSAAIRIASMMGAVNCIALNPQLDVKLFSQSKKLDIDKGLGIAFTNPSEMRRLDFINCLRNSENTKFFLYFNTKCWFDKQQAQCLEQAFAVKLVSRLQKIKKNIWILPVAVNFCSNQHQAQPDEFFCIFISKLLESASFTKENIALTNLFIGEMRKYYALMDELNALKYKE